MSPSNKRVTSRNVQSITVEMHVMDSNSHIIKQHSNRSLPKHPHYVSLYITTEEGINVVAMTFEKWQNLCLNLYTPIAATMLTEPHKR